MNIPHSFSTLARTLLFCGFIASAGCGALKQCAYEGFGRDAWQHPDQVIEELELRPGDQVADLGAGSGYFTFRLAKAVGRGGKVYAVDVDPDMVTLLKEHARKEGLANVEVILAEPANPHLPNAALDLLFACNVYHHLDDRAAYFGRLARHLKPDGRVAIIDFTKEGWFAWLTGHGTPARVIEDEMKEAGYVVSRRLELPKQVFLIFERSPPASSARGIPRVSSHARPRPRTG